MKKILLLILSVFCFTFSFSFTVYDPSNHKENILQRIESVKQTLENIKQTQNQIEQLKNDALNLANIDSVLSNSELIALQQSFRTMLEIQDKAKSQINDFKNFQNQFDNVYLSFDDIKNLSPEQYIYQANKILEQSRNVAEDALRTAGVVNPAKLQNDAQRVQALMRATSTVEGQKAALQANVQMAGMSYQVLNDMKLLLSQSLATQGTAIIERAEKEKMGREEYNRLTKKSVNVDNLSTGLLERFSDK